MVEDVFKAFITLQEEENTKSNRRLAAMLLGLVDKAVEQRIFSVDPESGLSETIVKAVTTSH